MKVERRTQQSRSDATRAALVAAARASFGSAGFAATSVAGLAAAAAVTRGALYHHFADKEALFEAAAFVVATELSAAASRSALAGPRGTSTRLLRGVERYLTLVAEQPEVQRILLVDGPAVLGWARWRRMQTEVVLPGLVHGIVKLMAEGFIGHGDPEALAHLVLATLNDAAMMIANARDPRAARNPVTQALMLMLGALTGGGATAASAPVLLEA